ncbi:putative carboxylesterase family protein [Phaeomoniella chlamydospora]|uniref:Carboxylic ester hydrolase n=1 Tax=Phaeomoniella chlamydospora TaxID=158046 RepID=A0A0G2FPV9_PHACM|nr:putative carboxylesterase family protein [Phaeomoniella chlamydospora]
MEITAQYLPAWTRPLGAPKVTIAQGTLIGTNINDGTFPAYVEAFLGIPYALPPQGELRYARPVPVPASNQSIDASKYGPRCPGKQLLRVGDGPDHYSEDCLTVNVFRQRGSASDGAKLSVAVYMHGGAFNRGTAKMHNTASMVAWSAEPFVAISFNYRIGALGFLNSAVTAKENLLNVGLRDQVLLLQWVKENVAAFGGDPNNVAIIGLSAGAHSIGHHIMNINSKEQLFHKAVMESGGPTSRAVHPYDSELHKEQFHQLLSEVGCDEVSQNEVLQCLRSVPSEEIIAGSDTVFGKWNPSVRWAWQPVIDDDLISRRPLEGWNSGRWNKVPILTGFNHNEGTMYVPKKMSQSNEFNDFFATLLPQLSKEDLKQLTQLYPDPSTHNDSPYVETRNISVGLQYKRVEAAYGQYAYVCPVRQTALLGSASQNDPPIYLYHWAVNRTVEGGANHGDQMYYETMNPDVRNISPTQAELAGFFHAYVTSFIVSGNPNTVLGRFGQRPEWKAFDNSDGIAGTMVFGEGNDERAGGSGQGITAQFVNDQWAKEECDFWWKESGNWED